MKKTQRIISIMLVLVLSFASFSITFAKTETKTTKDDSTTVKRNSEKYLENFKKDYFKATTKKEKKKIKTKYFGEIENTKVIEEGTATIHYDQGNLKLNPKTTDYSITSEYPTVQYRIVNNTYGGFDLRWDELDPLSEKAWDGYVRDATDLSINVAVGFSQPWKWVTASVLQTISGVTPSDVLYGTIFYGVSTQTKNSYKWVETEVQIYDEQGRYSSTPQYLTFATSTMLETHSHAQSQYFDEVGDPKVASYNLGVAKKEYAPNFAAHNVLVDKATEGYWLGTPYEEDYYSYGNYFVNCEIEYPFDTSNL